MILVLGQAARQIGSSSSVVRRVEKAHEPAEHAQPEMLIEEHG
jgi:hypothetical protein